MSGAPSAPAERSLAAACDHGDRGQSHEDGTEVKALPFTPLPQGRSGSDRNRRTAPRP